MSNKFDDGNLNAFKAIRKFPIRCLIFIVSTPLSVVFLVGRDAGITHNIPVAIHTAIFGVAFISMLLSWFSLYGKVR